MWNRFQIQSIYLYRQPVDMRKGMDGLSALLRAELDLDPMAPSVFVLTNRGRDKIKLLLWERNGFWVFYKRLVRQRFQWLDWFESDKLELSEEQFDLLLQGFNLNGMRPHNTLSIQHAF
jgi:hypothetical protein